MLQGLAGRPRPRRRRRRRRRPPARGGRRRRAARRPSSGSVAAANGVGGVVEQGEEGGRRPRGALAASSRQSTAGARRRRRRVPGGGVTLPSSSRVTGPAGPRSAGARGSSPRVGIRRRPARTTLAGCPGCLQHTSDAVRLSRARGYLRRGGARQRSCLPEGARLPQPSVAGGAGRRPSGDADAALVPLENSVEGSVPATLDELADGDPLVITREVFLPVTFALAGAAGHDAGRRCARGQPPARRWRSAAAGWRERCPTPTSLPVASTAGRRARRSPRGRVRRRGLRADRRAALRAGGAGRRRRRPPGRGHPVRAGHAGPAPPPRRPATTRPRWSRSSRRPHRRAAGAAHRVRGPRDQPDPDRVAARPASGSGVYCFSIDCEGHIADARVGEALAALHRVCADVRFLGSYPRRDGAQDAVPAGAADAEFVEARALAEARVRDDGWERSRGRGRSIPRCARRRRRARRARAG